MLSHVFLLMVTYINISVDGPYKASSLVYAYSCKFKLMYSARSGGGSCIGSRGFLQAEQTEEQQLYLTIY